MSKKRWRQFIARCYRELLLPLLPSWLHCLLPKVVCSSWDYLQCAQPTFAQSVRKKIHAKAFGLEKDIRTDQLDLYHQGHIVNRVESWVASGFKDRVDYSYPLLDKRIVEFALGLPPEMYYQNKKGRFLFREAVSGLLPKDIQWGNFKSEPTRVSLLFEIEKEALKKWQIKFKEEKRERDENAYIDLAKLQEQLSRLDSLTTASLEEKFEMINTIEKSIFVLKLK